MRKVLVAISPLVFAFFVACGGGDDKQPPPPATSPAGNATLGDIRNQVARAKKSCSDSITPAIIAAMSAKKQGATNPALLALLSQGTQGGQGGNCSNLLMNILLQAKTVDNGSWINNSQSKLWLALQVAGLMNKVGQGVQAAGYNPQQALNQLPVSQFVNSSLLPSMTGTLGGKAGSQLQNTVSQYTGGLPSPTDSPVNTGRRPPMGGPGGTRPGSGPGGANTFGTMGQGNGNSNSGSGGLGGLATGSSGNNGPNSNGNGNGGNGGGSNLGNGGGNVVSFIGGGPSSSGNGGPSNFGNGGGPNPGNGGGTSNGITDSGSGGTFYGGALTSIPLGSGNGIVSETMAGSADASSSTEATPAPSARALLPPSVQPEVVELQNLRLDPSQTSGLPRLVQ